MVVKAAEDVVKQSNLRSRIDSSSKRLANVSFANEKKQDTPIDLQLAVSGRH